MPLFEPNREILLQDAYEAAQALLNGMRSREHEDIVICSCREFPNAWVFGYNSRRFLQDGDFFAALVGNGPVVVPKSGEPPYLGGSGTPIEEQLEDRP